jgi:hypothetical protein
MTSNGVQMLMKAMGFDPQMVVAKAQEVEQNLNTFASGVQNTVSAMDARMARMEAMLVQILEGQQQQRGPTEPAGESSPELHVPLALIEAADEPKESKPNGRYTGNRSTHKGSRKSH